MIPDRLKLFIFKQLYKELSKVEIIPYENSIYFIDRENKYWYFEYQKNGILWWRYTFFSKFFIIFCLETQDREMILRDWMEEVLNYKVRITIGDRNYRTGKVEEVLNGNHLIHWNNSVLRLGNNLED